MVSKKIALPVAPIKICCTFALAFFATITIERPPFDWCKLQPLSPRGLFFFDLGRFFGMHRVFYILAAKVAKKPLLYLFLFRKI